MKDKIYEVTIGETYLSRSGIRFKVYDRVWYGMNCSVAMVCYINLDKTFDKDVHHKWVIEEDTFLKLFEPYYP